MSDLHECPVDRCDAQISRERLMCREHWFTVAKPLRDAVWRTWRGWRNGRNSGADYVAARDAAIAAANETARQETLL